MHHKGKSGEISKGVINRSVFNWLLSHSEFGIGTRH